MLSYFDVFYSMKHDSSKSWPSQSCGRVAEYGNFSVFCNFVGLPIVDSLAELTMHLLANITVIVVIHQKIWDRSIPSTTKESSTTPTLFWQKFKKINKIHFLKRKKIHKNIVHTKEHSCTTISVPKRMS
jgi:hypothetical protein